MRKLRSVVLNLAVLAMIWYGVNDVSWCWNLGRFFIWLTFIVSLFMFFATALIPEEKWNEIKEKVTKNRLPQWFTITTDLLGVAALAAFGHFVYASLWLIQGLIEPAIFNNKEK